MNGAPHQPVMVRDVVEMLAPRPGQLIVDATFGAGGYSRAILEAASCRVIGIDRDAAAGTLAEPLIARHGERLVVLHGRFGDMPRLLAAIGVDAVDGVAFDLGVSSMQLDQPARGFSFRHDGPLDMRMDPTSGENAAALVARLPEAELARVIREFGEERWARRVAKAIVRARLAAAITTTGRLAEIVRGAVPRAADGIDPATRTFQALRIEVNDELGELDRGLIAAERLLRPEGRLVVVAFHSLEDRRVKVFLRQRAGRIDLGSRHAPRVGATPPATFRLITGKPLTAGAEEVAINPRARSARLRAAERTESPCRPVNDDERRAA